MSLHRCFIERPSHFGWRAECSCGWTGARRWHPLLAEREADRHLGESRVLVTAPDAEPQLMTGPQVSELLKVQAERYAVEIIAAEGERDDFGRTMDIAVERAERAGEEKLAEVAAFKPVLAAHLINLAPVDERFSLNEVEDAFDKMLAALRPDCDQAQEEGT